MKNETFYDLVDSRIDKISEIYKNNEFLKKQNDNGKNHSYFYFGFLKDIYQIITYKASNLL